MKRKILSIAATLLVLGLATAMAQKADQKWTDWSKKEAQKILDDSPWGHIQTETDTREMMYTPTTRPQGSRVESGAVNQPVNLTFHVRFFSARPNSERRPPVIVFACGSDQEPPGSRVELSVRTASRSSCARPRTRKNTGSPTLRG